MSYIFTIILLSYYTINLDAKIQSTMIDADAAELTKFSVQLRESLPPTVHDLIKAGCQMISKCCPTVRSQMLSFALSGDKDKLIQMCFGNNNSTDYFAKIGGCQPIGLMMNLVQESDVVKFLSIDKSKLTFGKKFGHSISQVCPANDIMSIVCDSDKNNKLFTCQRRVLSNLARKSTEKVYMDKVAYMKMKAKEYGMIIKNAFSREP